MIGWRRTGWLMLVMGLGAVMITLVVGWPQVVSGQRQPVLCVRPDGIGGCYTTIQAAVEAAIGGDGILIAAETYTENVVITKSLTITGGWQPAGGWPLTETVILPAGNTPCLLEAQDVNSLTLQNLTLKESTGSGLCATNVEILLLNQLVAEANNESGASISNTVGLPHIMVQESIFRNNGSAGLIISCSSFVSTLIGMVTVENSTLTGNGQAGLAGRFDDCEYNLVDNEITGNSGTGISAIHDYCDPNPQVVPYPTMRGNVLSDNNIGYVVGSGVCGQGIAQFFFEGNTVTTNGVGAVLYNGSYPSLGELFADNTGAGISVQAATWWGNHTTIADNGGPGVEMRKRDQWNDAGCGTPEIELVNTIVWDNDSSLTDFPVAGCDGLPDYQVSISYTILANLAIYTGDPLITLGPGTFDSDPFFVGGGDYHLQPDSPAIDAGKTVWPEYGWPNHDGNGDCLARPDLGAYEAPAVPGICSYLPYIADQ